MARSVALVEAVDKRHNLLLEALQINIHYTNKKNICCLALINKWTKPLRKVKMLLVSWWRILYLSPRLEPFVIGPSLEMALVMFIRCGWLGIFQPFSTLSPSTFRLRIKLSEWGCQSSTDSLFDIAFATFVNMIWITSCSLSILYIYIYILQTPLILTVSNIHSEKI